MSPTFVGGKHNSINLKNNQKMRLTAKQKARRSMSLLYLRKKDERANKKEETMKREKVWKKVLKELVIIYLILFVGATILGVIFGFMIKSITPIYVAWGIFGCIGVPVGLMKVLNDNNY